MGELHAAFSRGLRSFLGRRVGPDDVEDLLHDTLIDAVLAIQAGDLRDSERLPGFLRGIAWRKVAGFHDRRRKRACVDCDAADLRDSRFEAEMARRERLAIAGHLLRLLPARDREILQRFYLDDEPSERIREALRLTRTQFSQMKWRAKRRLRSMRGPEAA